MRTLDYLRMEGTTLQWFGILVSTTTLLLIIGFRWWDSRTRLEITFQVVYGPDRQGVNTMLLIFSVLNRSKWAVYISRGQLEPNDGALPFPFGDQTASTQLQPGLPENFREPLSVVASYLLNQGYSGTVPVRFVVWDGTREKHQKSILLQGVEWSNVSDLKDLTKAHHALKPIEPLRPWWRRVLPLGS